MSVPSAEVAADFKDALQDLKLNSRPEISNLTIIAKENTEHAQAISHELEDHIRTTRPEWKLPSLYVLDSIVKNVGTPYTVYLGRNLYRTFMDSYLVMNDTMRRAMEGLLKTWKQPVPESMDPRPVFPPEVTGDIESALNKIRSVVQQTPIGRPMHALPPRPATTTAWRSTPTPPQNGSRHAAPQDPRARPPFTPGPQQYGSFPPAPGPSPYGTPQPQSFPSPMSSNDLSDLKTEVGNLITNSQQAFAYNPADTALQTKLQALLQLKKVLDTQTLPPQQLEAVRAQIRALAPPAPMPSFISPVSYPPPAIQSPHQAAAPTFPPPAGNPPLNLAQLLANANASARPPVPQANIPPPAPSTPNLADLIQRLSSPGQSSATPAAAPFFPPFSMPPAVSTPVQTPAVPAAVPAIPPNLADILAQFSKPASATPVPALQPPPQFPPPAAAAQGSAAWLLNAIKGLPLPATPAISTPLASEPMTRQSSALMSGHGDIELTTASLKKPRFHLISRLYEAYPNLCSTCGRRFEATAQGKEKKARHMDWHFKVKDPDAAKRGIHRSWYIGEQEWAHYKEADETSPQQPGNGNGAPAAPKKQTKDRYVLAPPNFSPLKKPRCGVCKDGWEASLNAEAGDWVLRDALKLGEKYYHATCYEDYAKAQGLDMPSTPDSVLGKRKGEVGTPVAGKKLRAY
ncbi:hypothetical protein P280DRAFT_320355 [Massarina eburnea CBS 473.64]|uniref:CID domain-containing protein n=1 Tax=Massarina eburnea CBS 473.64 TaxID=1395130 RepID=A0A6A6S1E8_9PLEO|nr:hypothetical protein P280DRAFT_320355 [Massarina eburnea CBS 473.64]